jgi:dsRNA-specific ribonuclease
MNYKKIQQLKNPQGSLVSGIRGSEFLTFIKNIMISYGKLTPDEANMIVSKNQKMFEVCFVHSSYDEKLNYELYEHFGDKIVDYSVSKYLLNMYPKLGDINGKNPALALKIVSKLHLYLRSKAFLSKAGELLGFRPFISANSSFLEDSSINSVYEDIFEALMGVIDQSINKTTKEDVGYVICYEILKSIFSQMDISLKYEYIIDARTRLKEYIQKRQAEEQRHPTIVGHTYEYGFITKTKPMIYSASIKFNVLDPHTGIISSRSTSVMTANKKQDAIDLSYKQFYGLLSRYGYALTISNIELVITQEGNSLTGNETDVQMQAYIIVDGHQTFFEIGNGYDEASAKESAAEKALTAIKEQGYDVTVGGWDESDWI